MKTPLKSPMRSMTGITRRITLMGWLVTLVTLAIFLVVIIPEQKRDFERNLESTALGVAASVRAVAATAAVSEDYSLVVDQAMQVLAGDQAVGFLVMTKTDGFSVIVDQAGWKTETLGDYWRPAQRVQVSSIDVVPDFGQRVFHFAVPFDYSGIQWGWIHVGLSLKSYDESVERIYYRTGALTLVCVALSLGISVLYAQRLVRPIHRLHTAVQELAQGNLQARAVVNSQDEIQRLAEAFNNLAGTVHARNQTLESVGFAAQELLTASEWKTVVLEVLASIGGAVAATRAFVRPLDAGSLYPGNLRLEWVASPAFLPAPPSGPLSLSTLPASWLKQLDRHAIVTARRVEMDLNTRAAFGPNVRSMILVPIFSGEEFWGALGFEDSAGERVWGEAEIDSFGAVARMLGAAMMRQRVQEALVEAKDFLEQRVALRTAELQAEIAAKDRAHKELAAAQERLIELSRKAGMAEVATGVLHNVGNVLNSVNVAATTVVDKLQQSRVGNLAAIAGLLKQHEADLAHFIQEDPKGCHVIPYLDKLGQQLQFEQQGMLSELDQLSHHVGHIKEIVAAQQSYATTAGFIEKISVEKLVDDAITISNDRLEKGCASIGRHFEPLPPLFTDRHKLLQIVLNLIRNAMDATRGLPAERQEIQVHLRRAGDSRFEVAVVDRGIGMQEETLTRIFQHGFTTKNGGHGFGLHSGALAAKALGGTLTATSEGLDRGATFVLNLPLRQETARSALRPETQEAIR
jgi:two-component system NtrC family sensor kinase